jgi:5S rRNA maturation endonuclease (ribonuclease M5)/KaiC/GvpD/RAD55 family RecA-like ATPase
MIPSKHIPYVYNDEQGEPIFAKIRVEPGTDGRAKSFYYQRKEGGATVNNIEGCRKILYRLPEIIGAVAQNQPVFLVEGEKDADNLLDLGLCASTAPVTIKWHDEYTQTLVGGDVIILYDNDKAGVQRRDMIANALAGKVKKLRVVDLPGIEYSVSHGKDVSDWLAMGNTIAQLIEIAEKTAEFVSSEQILKQRKGELRLISIDELIALKLPPREMLLAPFLPSQGLVLIVAKRGVGKTHIALGVAYAVASGGTFLCWRAPAAKRVLYVDGEMPASLMQERLQKIVSMSDKRHEEGFFKLLTPDLQDQVMPDLSNKQGRDAIEKFVENCDLVVIDNISCLFRSGSENEAESWQEAQEWALDLRRRGKSVLFVHHAGKSGNQRGTSKKEDALDAVLILKQPDDYQAEQGARFEIKFDKARHFSGDDARSFQVKLVTENGLWRWEMTNDSEEDLLEQIVDLKAIGYTIQGIVDKMGLTKSQVETLTAKAKARGMLK